MEENINRAKFSKLPENIYNEKEATFNSLLLKPIFKKLFNFEYYYQTKTNLKKMSTILLLI
jgi:hypothetical protein